MAAPREIVAVDIGGTHARFAIARLTDTGLTDAGVELGEVATLTTRENASFETAWESFAAMRGGALPRAASLAIAGPVGGETIRFTNNPGTIQQDITRFCSCI